MQRSLELHSSSFLELHELFVVLYWKKIRPVWIGLANLFN